MKETSQIIILVDMENIFSITMKDMMELGCMVNAMEKVFTISIMEIKLKVAFFSIRLKLNI